MKYINLIGLLVIILCSAQFSKAETDSTFSDTLLEGAPKIFLDCSSCDDYFIRREITFVSFVRDRNQADIHILVSIQMTGSGGNEYMVEFIGKHKFNNMTDTLIFNTKEADTDDAVRKEMVKYFKLGLTRFVSKTDLSKHMVISFTKPTKQAEIKDKWKNWIFELEGNFNINGEENYRSTGIFNEYETARITEELKIAFGIWWNYNDEKFIDSDGYRLYINRSKGTWGHFVFSLNDNWSAGYEYNFFASTYDNKDFDFSTETGLEYNIYPYKESSRRAWIVRWNLGTTYMDYIYTTKYNKTNEWLTYTRLRSAVEITQPWGSVYSSLNGMLYLHDFDINRVTFSAGLKVNLFEGFSVNVDGNYARTRDQISLSSAELTPEQVLLRQRQSASGYNYWVSFGVSYTFGSIYNNIVNPRF